MRQEIEKAMMQEWLKHTTATTVAQLAGAIHHLVGDGPQRKSIAVEFYWRMRSLSSRERATLAMRNSAKEKKRSNNLSVGEIERNTRVIEAIMARQGKNRIAYI